MPEKFPRENVNIVAPYWNFIDISRKGIVRYAVVTHNHTTLSYLLELTSDLVSTEDVAFTATWLLVVSWMDVCPYEDRQQL